jgi:hypothetical protein
LQDKGYLASLDSIAHPDASSAGISGRLQSKNIGGPRAEIVVLTCLELGKSLSALKVLWASIEHDG